jgi:hypothetical protein
VRVNKKVKAVIIYADGKTQAVVPTNGRDFKLAQLKAIVGGYIKIIPTNVDDMIMVLNEEGKLLDLPYNEAATSMVNIFPTDYIVGDVLVCPSSMVK